MTPCFLVTTTDQVETSQKAVLFKIYSVHKPIHTGLNRFFWGNMLTFTYQPTVFSKMDYFYQASCELYIQILQQNIVFANKKVNMFDG